MARVLLFTGKGGVGKTTIAAATALQAAKLGYKTLVMSVDPAHSLADALDTPLGPEPQEVLPNLYAQELDVYYSMQKHWGSIRSLLLTAFKWQGVSRIQAEELAALPGMEEASAFLWLEDFHSSDAFELIVVDSAPTGETLTFLTLPQVTQWWMQKAFPLQRAAAQSFGLMTRLTTGIPLDKGYEEIGQLFDKLERIKSVISDPERSSIRLVLNPERMVIREAQRAYSYLQLYGYPVDAVISNRMMPELPDTLFASYFAKQQAYVQEIAEDFAPLPLLQVPHLGQEVFGLALLERIAEALWQERDPCAVLHHNQPFEIKEQGQAYQLRVHLPFLTAEQLKVEQFADTLVIQADSRRRNMILPRFMQYYQLQDYQLEQSWLELRFVEGSSQR